MTTNPVPTVYRPAIDRYEKQEYRRAGRSGLDLPAFSLGLWQGFGSDGTLHSQREIVLHAFDLGITHLDNANRYGPPHRAAEKFLGTLLRTDLAAHRDELILSTKAGNPVGASPYLKGGSRKSLLASLDHSLRDLGTDYVDIFYSHRQDLDTPLEETVGALVSAVEQGKALYVGVSNYSPERTREAAKLLRAAGVPLLVHQPRYSVFDRRPEREGLFDLAADGGFGVVVYSPLAQGLLTDKYLGGAIPDGARAHGSAALSAGARDETYRQRAVALDGLARARGQSLAQLALQWVLRRPEVTSAIVGASAAWQLGHNVRALDFPPLTDAELAVVDQYGVHGTALTTRPGTAATGSAGGGAVASPGDAAAGAAVANPVRAQRRPTTARRADMAGPVVTAAELRVLLDTGPDVVVLEVGDLRSDIDLRAAYATAHIPGATYVSFEDDLRGASTGSNGASPLPEPADIEGRIREWGIDDGTPVVVYGRGRPGSVTRAWFVLRWAGVSDVRYLDGGWREWLAAGGQRSTGVSVRRPSSFVVRPGSLPTLTAAEAAALPGHGVLLDARGRSAYLGSAEAPDTTGHIPGARSAPSSDLIAADGTLVDGEGLAAYFAERGVDGSVPVGVYCGGGVAATFDLVALHAIGIPAAVYVGSWSEWIWDPSRPVDLGEAAP